MEVGHALQKGAAVFAGLFLFAGAACTNRDPGPYHAAIPPLPASEAASPSGDAGRVLYLRDCAWCHSASAEGTPRGPDLKSGTKGPADVDFVLRTRRMPLRRPDDPMRRGAATTTYSDADRRAIVAYLATLGQKGPPIPRVAKPPGLAHGAELYLANCAACHSATGIGGTLSAAEKGEGAPASGAPETYAPPVTSSNAVEVAEAIRVGPGTMPVFGPDTLSDDDVDAIGAYVEYLGHPADPGGIAAGHIGPVSEGAVGWIIGLGMLLAVCRWIGTRSGEEPAGEHTGEAPRADGPGGEAPPAEAPAGAEVDA